MKKLFMAAFASLLFILVSVNANAQKIISDTFESDGTRVVMFENSPKVCSSTIEIHILKNRITKVQYTKGCPGNTQGVSALIEGMKVRDAIKKLDGIQCGKRGTSCPDQLAIALKMIMDNPKKK